MINKYALLCSLLTMNTLSQADNNLWNYIGFGVATVTVGYSLFHHLVIVPKKMACVVKKLKAERDEAFAKYTTLKTAMQASASGLVIEHKDDSPLAKDDYKLLKGDGFQIQVATRRDNKVFVLITGRLPAEGLIVD